MRTPLLAGFTLLMLFLLALPAPAEAQRRGYRCADCGTIERVDRIWFERRDSGREGAIAGAIIGGAIGNSAGRRGDRSAATIAGAVIGGLIGREIDRNDGRGRGRGEPGLRLSIRMDSGYWQTIEIAGDMRLYRGDRVRLHRGRVERIR